MQETTIFRSLCQVDFAQPALDSASSRPLASGVTSLALLTASTSLSRLLLAGHLGQPTPAPPRFVSFVIWLVVS